MVENIISMNDMKKKEILDILELARKIENCSEEEKLKFLHGKIISTLFFIKTYIFSMTSLIHSILPNNLIYKHYDCS